MQKFQYTIQDPVGLHARPAGLLVKCAQGLASSASIEKGGKTADAKRLFAVMGLAVKQHDLVTFTLEGEAEQEDCETLRAFCEENI